MRECLKCKKDVSGKHESAKFCSTSCRVMWNRKHGKRDEIKPFQLQVLYNKLLELVDKSGSVWVAPEKVAQVIPTIKKSSWDEMPKEITQTYKSFEQFKKEKRECENEDDWEKLKAEIENSTLSTKEKTLLIKYN